MNEMLKRTELLIGAEGIEKLKNSHVAIAGIGYGAHGSRHGDDRRFRYGGRNEY